MSLITALIIYALFLGIYGSFIAAILWHIKEYTMDMDFSKWIIRVFLTIIIFLGVVSVILFFNLPLS